MNDSEGSIFQPVNDPIKPHSQVSSCIQIPRFEELMANNEIDTIQVFLERVAQEIYNTRKKNYSWGFRVIEPEFLNLADRMILVSQLYKEEHLAELNSVIFKLFVEFNNIIIATALHMHLAIKGIIRIGTTYRGTLRSRKPAVVSGKEPLILNDLLKVFSIGEIFPNGFSEGLIPAVEVPYHFGENFSKSFTELTALDSVGIFMPVDSAGDRIADVTVLSNMIVSTEVNGEKYYACNWKEWMREHSECSADNIIAFAEAEVSKPKSPDSRMWKSLVEYSTRL